MALLPTVKFAVSVAFLLASFCGLKHAGLLGPEKLGPLQDRLMGLLGKGPHSVSFKNYQHSKCQACLGDGQDFCISANKCIPRATFKCKGPEDHITGDLEFALHGNPRAQHSMKCPQPHEKGHVDSKDCYFDKECHAKVDWEKISKIKGGFFARLKMYKEKDDASAVKQMWVKVHEMFREAGMPDDRIDYILATWVKSVSPEALNKDKGDVDPKDCYFDKECHAKVDWEKIEKIKGGFFARLKVYKEKDDASAVKQMCVKVHEIFQEAGMPDDRIDYILAKWVKSVFPEALNKDKGDVDSKDCHFDKECHAKVDWEKIEKIKGGFFARLKMYKEKDDASAVKQMWVKVHEVFREAGMPDDRIDYILAKWVKSVFPEALNKDKGDVDPKDCYFDKECHAKVDWEKISKIKGGFFARLKMYKEKDDASAVRPMLVTAKELFQHAGMPDDRIDYTLVKWVKTVFPQALDLDEIGGFRDNEGAVIGDAHEVFTSA